MFSPANVFQYMVLRKISAPYSFETSSSLQVATEAIKFHGHGEKNNRSFSQAKDTWSIGWMPLSEILCPKYSTDSSVSWHLNLFSLIPLWWHDVSERTEGIQKKAR